MIASRTPLVRTGPALRRWLRPLRIPAAGLGVVATTWLGGLLWFAGTIPRDAPGPGSPELAHTTDAIVVLTGGSERLSVGLDLLHAGRGLKLFVSGVNHTVDLRELLRSTTHQTLPHPECCIVLGHAAADTVGNATETAAWMRAERFTSLRLVTANYHLRRALLEFHKAMPEAEIVPHPVVPSAVRISDWWMWRRTTGLIVTEYNKYLVALARYTLTSLLGFVGSL